jgi:hypothetical protein
MAPIPANTININNNTTNNTTNNTNNTTNNATNNTVINNKHNPALNPSGPLSRYEQIQLNKQLHRLFDNHVSENGVAAVSGMNGPPIHVAKVPIPRVGSSKASPSTLKARARFVETIRDAVSSQHTSSSASDSLLNPDVHAQLVHEIKRNKQGFEVCAAEAGINITRRFTAGW